MHHISFSVRKLSLTLQHSFFHLCISSDSCSPVAASMVLSAAAMPLSTTVGRVTPMLIQRSDTLTFPGFPVTVSSSHWNPHLEAGSDTVLISEPSGFFVLYFSLELSMFLSISLTSPLIASHQSSWVVRSLHSALCFPSSSSSLSKYC